MSLQKLSQKEKGKSLHLLSYIRYALVFLLTCYLPLELLILKVFCYLSFIYLVFYPHLRTFFFHCFQREKGREKERERHQCDTEASFGCFPVCSPTGDQTLNLGMCPDWKSEPQLFSLLQESGVMLQPIEPHWPGCYLSFK